ncbi:MAG: carboxypeptidase regulatory-like domain-containing protein [Vicinamibacterales bacterium]
MKHVTRIVLSLLAVGVFAIDLANAQGVTTGSLAGKVVGAGLTPVAGASVIAIHLPSGTSYEATTRADGRFLIPGVRVGGPYSVTVAFAGTGGAAFQPETQEDIMVALGNATDLSFTVQSISVTETITVTAKSDTIFNSDRTGSATAISRETIAALPTINNRIDAIIRLAPEARGMSLGGQDNRMNNFTVDGSYFNNSFGLAGAPGERTNVAPISMEAIEQVQVSVAPYDVRQGNFIGGGVNTVTRSGSNQFSAGGFYQLRNQSLVGKEAKGLAFNPGTFDFKNGGGWASGPIVKNTLFFFGNLEGEKLEQPGTTFRANAGGETAAGSVTRVLASDLNALGSFLKSSFSYDPGLYQDYPFGVPGRRTLVKLDYNLNTRNKLSFRYNELDSDSDILLSNSSSLGFGTRRSNLFGLNFSASNYKMLEKTKWGIGELNTIIGTKMSNSLIIGYSSANESRGDVGKLFPLVDVLQGGSVYTSFGSEPFTPNNELYYKTFQLQDSFTRYGEKHSLTFGTSFEKYNSTNVFFPGKQSAYIYNSLADFYADAQGFLANPNRTTSPITLGRFQVRYSNIPGQEKPIQPLEVKYVGGYAQDEWNVRDNLKVIGGVRGDVAIFGDTAYTNALADALSFRDQTGATVRYSSGKLPESKILWSPRIGFNWNVRGDRSTQVRGGSGIFTGKPPYVWISNQIGNTGVLTGFIDQSNTAAFPFNPNPDRYKPTNVTGAPAAAYELNVTSDDFRFPQLWRTNLGLDHRLPWNVSGTLEFVYNRDVNGMYYINANLPAAQTTFAGADTRPRYTTNRINSNIAGNYVLQNQDIGRSWTVSASAKKVFRSGFVQTAYNYGEAKNTIDPGSIASGSFTNNAMSGDPNNPGLSYSASSPGHRFYFSANYRREYFNFGATSFSLFWEARTIGNTSYAFTGDANGDASTNNDLIYIPRNTSEMNFQDITGAVPFTAAQQAAAWEAYIQQDPYLSKHRGEYAVRNAVFLPIVRRMDLSVAQDVFTTIGGKRQRFQFRADFINFGNLLNHDWGVGQRLVSNQPLTNPSADASGRLQYRLRVVNNQLMSTSYQSTSDLIDVYKVMLSFRYFFN